MPLPNMPILDAVKQGSAALAAPVAGGTPGLAPTAGEKTEQVAGLAAAAQSGKEQTAGAGGVARLSAIGEKLASLNTTIQANALQTQGTLQATAQGQQAAATQQQYQGQVNLMTQQRISMRTDFNNKLNGMLQQSAEQLQSLTIQDNRSRAEQMGTMLRLSNDEYVTKLNDQATRDRLTDAASFKMALATTVFDQETALFSNNLAFRNMLQQDHRNAVDAVASMDLDFAMSMATTQNKSAAANQMWSGVGTAGGTAAAGALYAYNQPSTPDQPGPVYSDAGTGGAVPTTAAQNPAGYDTTPSSVDTSGNVQMPYTSPTAGG